MKILLFGITREIVGQPVLLIDETGKPETVNQLKELLIDRYPALAKLTSLAIAVNGNYAGNDDSLDENAEIALIPPVSGG